MKLQRQRATVCDSHVARIVPLAMDAANEAPPNEAPALRRMSLPTPSRSEAHQSSGQTAA